MTPRLLALAVAASTTLGVVGSATAADLGTVTVDYDSGTFSYTLSPTSLTGVAGDTFTLQNNRNNSAGADYVSIMNGTGSATLAGTPCTLTSSCTVPDSLSPPTTGIVTLVTPGTFTISRDLNGVTQTIGTLTVNQGTTPAPAPAPTPTTTATTAAPTTTTPAPDPVANPFTRNEAFPGGTCKWSQNAWTKERESRAVISCPLTLGLRGSYTFGVVRPPLQYWRAIGALGKGRGSKDPGSRIGRFLVTKNDGRIYAPARTFYEDYYSVVVHLALFDADPFEDRATLSMRIIRKSPDGALTDTRIPLPQFSR